MPENKTQRPLDLLVKASSEDLQALRWRTSRARSARDTLSHRYSSKLVVGDFAKTNTTRPNTAPGTRAKEVCGCDKSWLHPQKLPVYYGSSVALRGHHGGYLVLDSTGRVVSTSERGSTPSTLFTIRNMSNLSDGDVVKYGDRVWLQCSRYEVLGSSPQSENYEVAWKELFEECHEAASRYDSKKSPDWNRFSDKAQAERKIVADTSATLAQESIDPQLDVRDSVGRLRPVYCSAGYPGSIQSARHTGRWVVTQWKASNSSFGKPVMHLDEVAFQQEWLYISSRKPGEIALRVSTDETSRAVEKVHFPRYNGERRLNKTKKGGSLEREFAWGLHVVKQPANFRSGNEQKVIDFGANAKHQLKKSHRMSSKTLDLVVSMPLLQDQDMQAAEERMLFKVAKAAKKKLSSHARRQDQLFQSSQSLYPRHVNLSASGNKAHDDQRRKNEVSLQKNSLLREQNNDLKCELEIKKSAYINCLRKQKELLVTFSSPDLSLANEQLNKIRAVTVIQRCFKARLKCKWPWKMAKIDREVKETREKLMSSAQEVPPPISNSNAQSNVRNLISSSCRPKKLTDPIVADASPEGSRLRTHLATARMVSKRSDNSTRRPVTAPARAIVISLPTATCRAPTLRDETTIRDV